LKIKETVAALNTEIEAIKQDLVAEIVQQKSSAISSTVMGIKDELALKYTSFQNEEQQRKNEFISERDMFLQKLDAYYNETITEYENKIAEIRENAKERFSAFNNYLVAQYNEVASFITTSLEAYKTNFTELAEKLKSMITEDLNTQTVSLTTNLSQVEDQIDSLVTASNTNIANIYEETANNIQEKLKTINETIFAQVEETVEQTIRVTNALLSLSKKEIEKAKELVTGFLDKEIEESMNFLDQAEEKLDETAKELMSVTTKLEKDFKTLEATTKHRVIPAVETTTVIGLEAVKDHMKRILQNTKSKATILVPRPEDVPVEIIKTLPRTAQVIIVTKLDPELKREWLVDVFGAQANVQVRALREGGAGGGLGMEMPTLYAIERENEEVLFAAEDETTKEIVGILSHSTKFAQIISYTMISHYATGVSKQISKSNYQ